MFRCLAIIAGTLIILSGAMLSNRAEAGASASAPSKYSRANQQVASQQGQTKKNDFGITEYSSSSARNRTH